MEALCKIASFDKEKNIDISKIKGNGFDIKNIYVDDRGIWMTVDITDPDLKYTVLDGTYKEFKTQLSLIPFMAEVFRAEEKLATVQCS